MKRFVLILLLSVAIISEPKSQENSCDLEKIIKQNLGMVNLFDHNLCLIEWDSKFSVKIYKNKTQIQLTTLEAKNLSQIKRMFSVQTQQLVQPTLPSKTIIFQKYLPKKENKECKLKTEQNALLGFECLETTPLWWRLRNHEQLEEVCKYYAQVIKDLKIDSEKKIPLLITLEPPTTKSLFFKSLYSDLNPEPLLSPESVDFLNQYFDIVKSTNVIQGFAKTKEKIEALEVFIAQNKSENWISRQLKSLELNTILAGCTLFLLTRILNKRVVVNRRDSIIRGS